MKDWIKDNIVGIAFGLLGSASLIGSIASQVQDMAAAYPNAFWWWTAAAALLGALLGVGISGLGAKRADGRLAAIREAEETKRRAKAEEEGTKRARIEAESKAEIERMRQEVADRKELEDMEAARLKATREAEEKEEREEKWLVSEFRKSSVLIKNAVMMALDGREMTVPLDYRIAVRSSSFIEFVPVSEVRGKLSLTDGSEEFFDRHHELLEEYRRDNASVM